jgi:hypothetical protein
VQPVAAAQRYVAPHAGPSPAAASEALHGRAARRGAPLPEALPDGPLLEAPLDEPWPVEGLPAGRPALLRRVGHDLDLGRTSRCSA